MRTSFISAALKTKKSSQQGFTLVEIMIVVLVIGILLAIAVPNLNRARETSYKRSCVGNLRRIQYAKDSYLMDRNRPYTTPESEFTDTILYGTDGYLKSKPLCPGGGTYSPHDGGSLPTCDYGGGTVHLIVGD